MKLFKSLDVTIILFFSFLCLLILSIWFREGNLFIGAEEGIIFYRIDYIVSKMASQVWLELYLGHPYFSDLSKLPIYFFLAFLQNFGLTDYFLQFATFFMILFGSSVSVYYLFKITFGKTLVSQYAAFSGTIFYLCNPFVISQVWGRGLYQQFFAYLYFPLFLLLVVLFLQTKKMVFLNIGLLVSFVLSAAMGNPTYFISLCSLVFMYIFFFFWDEKRKGKSINFLFSGLTFFGLGWIIINGWWFFTTLIYAPTAYLGPGSVFENSLESLQAISNQNSFTNIIRLYHGPHFESGQYGKIYQSWIFNLISWMLPLIAACSVFSYKIKSFKFYLSIFIVGLFVCLGLNPPFGNLFEFIFRSISPLQVFRNPYEKFGLVYLLGYSALFGLGLATIVKSVNQQKFNGYIPAILILVFISVVYCWPLWTGKMIAWGTQVQIPPIYKQLDDWLNRNNLTQTRILFTPYLSSFGASYNWPGGKYHGNDPLNQILDSSAITQTGTSNYLTALKQHMGSTDLKSALALARIGFIVERKDVVAVRRDLQSIDFFTSNFQRPEKSNVVCDQTNLKQDSGTYSCNLTLANQNLLDVYLLDIELSGEKAGYLNIYLEDSSGVRPRWNGKYNKNYHYNPSTPNELQKIRIFLNDPSENPDTNFSGIKKITVTLIPFVDSLSNNPIVHSISALGGETEQVSGITRMADIGNMQIFRLDHPTPVEELLALKKIEYVNDFQSLFNKATEHQDNLALNGFLISEQNSVNPPISQAKEFAKESSKKKLSESKYYMEFNQNQDSLIVLNKQFNTGWKAIIGVSEKELLSDFFGDLKLLMKSPIREEHHYQVNGYANLWHVTSDTSQANIAIVYIPQLLMDVLLKISIWFTIFIAVTVIGKFLILKKRE